MTYLDNRMYGEAHLEASEEDTLSPRGDLKRDGPFIFLSIVLYDYEP